MNTNRRIVVGKDEATEGTKETLADADGGILAISPKVDTDIAMHPRNVSKASIGILASLPGAQLSRLTFSLEMKGPGSAYSSSMKPAAGKYLRGCGYAETIDTTPSAEKATYKPASTGVPSMTLGCYEDGVIKTLYGCRGNVKFALLASGPVIALFDFLGVYDPLTDGAMLTPTNEPTDPPVFLGASFVLGAYSPIFKGINIDMVNKLYLRDSVNNASGYLSTVITKREPVMDFDPEMVLAATYDWYGLWKAGTTAALDTGVIGGTQYNRFQITAPKVNTTKISDDDREDQAVAGYKGDLAENTGDDEIVIEFS